MKLTNLIFILLFTIAGCSSTVDTRKSFSYSGKECPEILKSDDWGAFVQKPRYGDAMIASLFGQQDVSRYITGGNPSRTTLYDFNGNPFSQTSNQNGDVLKVVNESTGCPIGRREYSDRMVFFTERSKAPGFKYKSPN